MLSPRKSDIKWLRQLTSSDRWRALAAGESCLLRAGNSDQYISALIRPKASMFLHVGFPIDLSLCACLSTFQDCLGTFRKSYEVLSPTRESPWITLHQIYKEGAHFASRLRFNRKSLGVIGFLRILQGFYLETAQIITFPIEKQSIISKKGSCSDHHISTRKANNSLKER